jgi:hypothetical protein
LSLGVHYSGPGTYCAPYVAVMFPDDLDRYEHDVVAGAGVRLRSAASADAPIVTTLTYEIVRVVERGPQWTSVRTLGGDSGYVATQFLYSPMGYRACFASDTVGAWRPSVLVAGD